MPDSDFTPEPDEMPVLYTITTAMGPDGPDGKLAIVTEDGRALRITGIRYPGGDVQRLEITVAEGDA